MILKIAVIILVFVWLHRIEQQREDCYMYLPQMDLFVDDKSNNSLGLITKYITNRTIGRQQNIPYNIFQTNEGDMVPWKMNFAIHSVVEKNPEFTYRFFNSSERRDFIVKHYGSIVTDAYDKLNPNAFKADLFRLLVVYAYGGCYIDNPFIAFDSLVSAFDPKVTFFSSLDGKETDWFINAAFFCAVPGHQILKLTIQIVIKSIAGQKYERDALNVTGPRKVGQAFNLYNNISQIKRAGYYDNGKVLILQRGYGDMCNMYQVFKQNGQTLIMSRYPDYLKNMLDYTNLPHYHVYFEERNMYKKQIEMQVPQDYQLDTPESYRSRGNNYLVPFEFRQSNR